MSDKIRKMIRELVEEELEEVSTSAGAGPYKTPFAFRGNSKGGKDKQKANVAVSGAGHEMVGEPEKADEPGDSKKRHLPFGEKSPGALKKESKINETKYTEFKMSEGTPAQKIGKAIREINRQISEVDQVLRMNERLKTESGVKSDQLWKSTARGLTKLEGRMNTLSTRIRNLKA